MSKLLRLLVLVAILLSVSVLYALGDPDDVDAAEGEEAIDEAGSSATVTYVEGDVVKRPEEKEDWTPALLNSSIVKGYKVRTHVESRAELTLSTRSIIRLAPRTTVDIVKLYEETREGFNETLFEVEEGDLWASVEGLGDSDSFAITSDIMGTACRGTTYRINVAADGTTMLRVYEGAVELWDPMMARLGPGFWETAAKEGEDTEGKYEVTGPREVTGPVEVTEEEWRLRLITSMRQIVVGPDGEIIRSGSFSKDDYLEQSDWVLWNHERDQLEAGH
ncbi:FecR family protein [bacterium]|nr:FecR family protein [bacterium]